MSADPAPDQIMQVGLGFWPSKTLLSAIEMELFTEPAWHPEDGDSLRERLGLHPRSSGRAPRAAPWQGQRPLGRRRCGGSTLACSLPVPVGASATLRSAPSLRERS